MQNEQFVVRAARRPWYRTPRRDNRIPYGTLPLQPILFRNNNENLADDLLVIENKESVSTLHQTSNQYNLSNQK